MTGGRQNFTEVPVVDLNLLHSDKPAFLAQLKHALVDVGFLYLKNAPGFDQKSQERLFELGHKFFEELPMEARMKIVENANFAGYKPPGLTELLQEFHFTYGHDKLPRDKAEIPLWKRVICGPNQWPAEFELPGFRAALLAHRDACDSLNKVLQRSTAEMLGLDPSTFDKYFWGPNGEKNGFVSTRVLHYTPMAEADPERVARLARAEGGDPLSLGSHRDGTAFFTLLINDGPGLEVLNHAGQWIQAPPKAGHIIVNIGMPLMLLTGGYLLATMHRVNANLAPQKRISIPNFLSPDPSVPLDTLPQFQPKALSAEAAAAVSTAAVNLAAWNENDTPKRILLQRRISHPRTMERYWPEVARQLDEELGSAIKLKL